MAPSSWRGITVMRWARRSTGLVLDPADRLTGLPMPNWSGGGRVEFLPGLQVLGKNQLDARAAAAGRSAKLGPDGVDATIIDPLVLVAGADTCSKNMGNPFA